MNKLAHTVHIDIPAQQCTVVVPDLSEYFTTASAVIEANRNAPLQVRSAFIATVIAKIDSSSLAAGMDFIRSVVRLTPTKTRVLTARSASSALGQQIRRLVPDPLALGATAFSPESVTALQHLSSDMTSLAISSDELVGEYRSYLIRSLSRPQCAVRGVSPPARVKSVLASLLALGPDFSGDLLLAPFAGGEIQMPSNPGYYGISSGRNVLNRLKALRFGGGHEPLSVESRRNSSDWRRDYYSTLNDIRYWRQENDESADEVFVGQCTSLYDLLGLATDADLKAVVESVAIEILSNAESRVQSVLWVYEIRRALGSFDCHDKMMTVWAANDSHFRLQRQIQLPEAARSRASGRPHV